MSHLNEVGYGYFKHLYRAWRIAFILLVHGLFPNVWKTKASDELCKERLGDDATRAYMLKHMYGIVEKKYEETPSIWDRLSDRELAVIQEKSENNK
jgi:hypothetical protein